MDPLVSVIVPCFNGAQYLEQAVKSVLAQTFTNLECIIVDDGSTDNTRQVSESLVHKDSRVKYFYRDNGGVASARNFAIRRAKGEWIQFLDADDWLHKDKIDFQLSYLDTLGSSDKVVFYSDYEYVYEDRDEIIVKRVPIISGNFDNEQLIERACTKKFAPFPAPILSLLVRKTVFEKKMMNEDFKQCSDLEFIIDTLLRGVPFIYTPIIGWYYRKHPSYPSLTSNRPGHEHHLVLLFEFMHSQNLHLRNPLIVVLIKKAFLKKDRDKFNRLIKLIDIEQMPICFSNGTLRIKNKFLLKVAFLSRLLTPISILRAISMLYCRLQTVTRGGDS